MASSEQDAVAHSSWLDSAEAASLAGLPVPGQIIAGKYRIEELIGRGGMGAVYRATHVVMEKPVALKWLFPDFSAAGDTRQRFVHEARAAARIRHPNVVDVYDVGDENGALYMVMELLEGESLEALIQRGPIPVSDMLQLLTQAIRGVVAAHAKGIVHRDIKPENIFVVADSAQPSGRNAKVLDFGVSKLGEDARRSPGLTKTGMVMGTPLYMSIEQMNGARDVDARTDVYAFGVLLYRALTGHLPFHGETFAALAVAVATHTPTAPRSLRPDIPAALNDLVVKAMARRREDRHATLDELLQELLALRAAAGDQMTEPSRLPAGMTPVSRERLRADVAPWAESGGVTGAQVSTLREPAPVHAANRLGLWIALALVGVALAGLAAWRMRPGPEARAPQPPAVPAQEQAPAPAAGPAEPASADWDHSGELQVIEGQAAAPSDPRALPAAAPEPSEAPMEARALGAQPRETPTPEDADRGQAEAVSSAPRARDRGERKKAQTGASSSAGSASQGRTGGASPAAPGPAAPVQQGVSAAPGVAAPAPNTPPASAKPADKGSTHRSGGVSLDEF